MRGLKRCFIAVFLAGTGAFVAVPLAWAQTLDWDPKSLIFKMVLVDHEAYRTLRLINTDQSETLVVTGIEYAFNDRDAFGWSTIKQLPIDVPPGSSMEVELSFKPPDISFFMAELHISNNSKNAPVLIYSFLGMGSFTTTTSTTTTSTTTTTALPTTTTTLPVPVCGDPSGDGNVTAADALFTLRVAVGSKVCALWVCDVNNDGKVVASDAQTILHVAVGLPIVLLCPS